MAASTAPIVNTPVTKAELGRHMKSFAKEYLVDSLKHLEEQLKKDLQLEVMKLLDSEGALVQTIISAVLKKIESPMNNVTKKAARTCPKGAESASVSSFGLKLKRCGKFARKRWDTMKHKSISLGSSIGSDEDGFLFMGSLSEFIGEKAPTNCLGTTDFDQERNHRRVVSPESNLVDGVKAFDIDKTTEWMEQERLACFHGDVSGAFQTMPETELVRRSDFTPLDQLTRHGVEICKDVDFLPGPAGEQLDVACLFPALCDTDFQRRFHERRKYIDCKSETRYLSTMGAPFAAAATLTCTMMVPVMGPKQYFEKNRLVFAKSQAGAAGADSDERVFVSHIVGHVDLGRLGALRAETVTFLSQRKGGKIKMSCIASKPKGWFASQMAEGYRQGVEDFHRAAKEFFHERGCPAVSADVETLPRLLKHGSQMGFVANCSDGAAATCNDVLKESAAHHDGLQRFPEDVLPTAISKVRSAKHCGSLAPPLNSVARRGLENMCCTSCCFIGLESLIRSNSPWKQKHRH